MTQIHVDTTLPDEARRERLFAGDLFHFAASPSVEALCVFADSQIAAAFAGHDPLVAQFAMTVEAFVAIAGQLKRTFTNHEETRRLVQAVLAAQGCDLNETYFDVPRLRVVTTDSFLSTGVGYAYKPHRDTWYASPSSQVNWWIPVHDLVPGRTLSLFPALFDTALANSSGDFDYHRWTTVDRDRAAEMIAADTRQHPVPLEDVDRRSDLRMVSRRASLFQFSAAHLHETVPNTSGATRFSLDFRTVHLADLRLGRGAPNHDAAAAGTTLGDFLSAADYSPFPTDLLALTPNRR
jgi:hypothetical protein